MDDLSGYCDCMALKPGCPKCGDTGLIKYCPCAVGLAVRLNSTPTPGGRTITPPSISCRACGDTGLRTSGAPT